MPQLKQIDIYTDGSSLANPGPGGYGAVLLYRDIRKELSGGFAETTNNRMEILAAIVSLEALKESCNVTLYSDSKYVVDSIEKGWAKRWKANGWMRNKNERAINPDLWERLLALTEQHNVKFRWVRGHAGVKENERCDHLANASAKSNGLPADPGYKQDFRKMI